MSELVIENIRLADNWWARLRGLLGTATLAADAGLLLVPANSIHTFFMRFTIDAIFLDNENIIVKIYHSLPPFRVAGCWRATKVLELATGAAARRGMQIGDRIIMRNYASVGGKLSSGREAK